MAWVFLFWGVFLALVALERPAAAADLPLKAPANAAPFDWTGFYVGGHVGYAFEHWMVYATGGFAWSLGRFLQTPGAVDDVDKLLHLHAGWAAGAGAEVAIAPMWTARLEYLYRNFGHAEVTFPSGSTAG